ncbi:MAG TPA: 3-methyl-2-oxobutanoate hydroxymethyltransferase [Gammaproteobacteria bacterium]|nr:3-methyl-2-oxobutanoate hydroxymethyltransferase [Gammaproteobacteria bacterium]
MHAQPVKKSSEHAVTVTTLAKMKQAGEKIACLTAYDASFAALLDAAGVDVILVGDTLGNVIQGHATTLPVTVDDVVYHTRCVARGIARALLVADMPFMSYTTPERALDNAARLMQEGGAHMVKPEVSGYHLDIVRCLSANGVPVCAHLGLRPQQVHKLGGFRVQGRDSVAAKQMLEDALMLEQAGADIILLESVPRVLAAEITRKVKVPVIGIGAGADVDGQILVLYDMLDITQGHRPKFARNFMMGAASPRAAVQAYVSAVRDGSYPVAEHWFE